MGAQQKYFAVSIDTERDHGPRWRVTVPPRFRSVTEAVPHRLQPLFERFGVRPTYLLTTEVLSNQDCRQVFAALEGKVELGTHLHMETSLVDGYGEQPKRVNLDFSGLCPQGDERAALQTISDLFRKAFGRSATSFRAGRYGATAQTLGILKELGYLVDTSVTPGIRWRNYQGTVDFREAPLLPYWPNLSTKIAEAASETQGILEIPVSIVLDRLSWKWPFLNYPVWLRPSHSSPRNMIRVLDLIEAEAANADRPVVANMMFHSMELFAGASPYSATDRDVQRYLDDLSFVFEVASERGYEFLGLTEIHHRVNQASSLKQSA